MSPRDYHRTRRFQIHVEQRASHPRIEPERGSVLVPIVIVLVALAILVAATGCNFIPKRPDAPKTSSLVPHMNGSAYLMDSWVWIGIAITVVGVFLMVFMKEGRLPLALVATGGAALGLVFVLKAVLPWIPWLIGGAIALGLLWLYARYHKKFKAMLLNGNGHGKAAAI